MTVMIKQRSEYDCALCCLCMATGVDYSVFPQELIDAITAKRTCSGENLDKAYECAGIKRDVDFITSYTDGLSSHVVEAMIWQRRAILQLPSLNLEGGMHLVYWDGQNIQDPSNKQVYRWIKNLRPVYVWLFREGL